MQHTKQIAAALAIGLLGATAAQANVVYNWQPASDSDTLTTLGGQLVVTDSAYASGALDVDYAVTKSDPPEFASFPNSPLISATFEAIPVGNVDVTTIVSPVRPNPTSEPYIVDANFSFIDGGLDGLLYLNDSNSDFGSIGQPGQWTITDYRSDEAICPIDTADNCNGATGDWILDASTVPTNNVPAPAGWMLLGLGVLSMLGLRLGRSRSI